MAHVSRRDLMLAAVCWADVLTAQTPPSQWAWFDASTAAEIRAIAGEIIPETDTPGADRAGVIWFIDRALAGYDQDKRDLYARGLRETQSRRMEMFPGSTSIESLTPDQRIALLKAIEKTEFFKQVRFHTILGFLGHPMHGGNRDMVGWKMLGLEPSMHYEPPFGYYDSPTGGTGPK
jgi:gluconate 2-dehydrogenase gamma chain